jgi:hypothetical protein
MYCGIAGDSVSYSQAALRCVESVHSKLVIGECVAHTVGLMIEGVSNVAELRAIVERTREVAVFCEESQACAGNV